MISNIVSTIPINMGNKDETKSTQEISRKDLKNILYYETGSILRYFKRLFSCRKYDKLLRKVAQTANAYGNMDIQTAKSIVSQEHRTENPKQYDKALAYVTAVERFQKHTITHLQRKKYSGTKALSVDQIEQITFLITTDMANTVYRKICKKARPSGEKKENLFYTSIIENRDLLNSPQGQARLLRNYAAEFLHNRAAENQSIDQQCFQPFLTDKRFNLLKSAEKKTIIENFIENVMRIKSSDPLIDLIKKNIALGREKDNCIEFIKKQFSLTSEQVAPTVDIVFALSTNETFVDKLSSALEILAKKATDEKREEINLYLNWMPEMTSSEKKRVFHLLVQKFPDKTKAQLYKHMQINYFDFEAFLSQYPETEDKNRKDLRARFEEVSSKSYRMLACIESYQPGQVEDMEVFDGITLEEKIYAFDLLLGKFPQSNPKELCDFVRLTYDAFQTNIEKSFELDTSWSKEEIEYFKILYTPASRTALCVELFSPPTPAVSPKLPRSHSPPTAVS